ncbi:putative toxin-antitoxin system toxin component, PIN family [Caldimonas sp. KR1-144]|uniref:putative toxin-antitoxin system toxin component, PIN family n=1 Tax=Caldimonas sp. KR1-144 TaxID=3400911 RepID=UPI003BFB0D50
MTKLRSIVVLDTNAVLDWLVFREPTMQSIGRAIVERQMDWFATAAMREELMLVLARTEIQNWHPDLYSIEAQWAAHAQMLEAPPSPPRAPRCTDPDDQIFIDLALAHRARWLVSRDRAVLRLKRALAAHGVQVLAPPQWQPD